MPERGYTARMKLVLALVAAVPLVAALAAGCPDNADTRKAKDEATAAGDAAEKAGANAVKAGADAAKGAVDAAEQPKPKHGG